MNYESGEKILTENGFGGKEKMSQPTETAASQKTEIVTQIAKLSRLLGMIPSDDAVQLHEPLTQHKMVLADWLRAARASFLDLSLLISKAMDIELQ